MKFSRVLGIDVGLHRTAVAQLPLDAFRAVKWHGINFDTLQGSSFEDFVRKLAKFSCLKSRKLSDSLVVVEGLFGLRGKAMVLYELMGIIKSILVSKQAQFIVVPPQSLKLFATGDARAKKSDMVKQAFKEFQVEAKSEDEIDAFWAMLFGLSSVVEGDWMNKRRTELVNKYILKQKKGGK